MDVEKELAAMQERMFSRGLLNTLLDASAREWERDGRERAGCEKDDLGPVPGPIFNEEQKAAFIQAEMLFMEMLSEAVRFAFSRGCCAGFQQFFVKNAPEDPFIDLVVDSLLAGPDTAEKAVYRAKEREADEAIKGLKESLPGKARERMLTIEAMWEERHHGIQRHSFILGCRYALSLIGGTGWATASFARKIKRIEEELKVPEWGKYEGV